MDGDQHHHPGLHEEEEKLCLGVGLCLCSSWCGNWSRRRLSAWASIILKSDPGVLGHDQLDGYPGGGAFDDTFLGSNVNDITNRK